MGRMKGGHGAGREREHLDVVLVAHHDEARVAVEQAEVGLRPEVVRAHGPALDGRHGPHGAFPEDPDHREAGVDHREDDLVRLWACRGSG